MAADDRIRIDRSMKDRIKRAAMLNGETQGAFVARAVRPEVERVEREAVARLGSATGPARTRTVK